MTDEPQVLICRCAYDGALPPGRASRVAAVLEKEGVPFRAVPDLCELAARRDPWLVEWVRRPGRRIVACYPRAVANLLDAAGANPPSPPQVVNLRERDAASALADLGVEGNVANLPLPFAEREDTSWVPWFPVLDRARCTDCRQCVDFCLFGVYVDDGAGRIEVRHPERCKLHCPACARICPHAAIIFPKHHEAPIDGAEITDEAAEEARIRHDLHELLGDDLEAAFAERKRRARARAAAAASADRPPLLDADRVRQALEERARHAAPREPTA